MSDFRPGDQVLVKSVGTEDTFEGTLQKGGATLARVRLPLGTHTVAKVMAATRRAQGVPMAYGDEQALIDEAVTHLEAAAKQQPDKWVCPYRLKDFNLRIKRYEHAVDAGERALPLRPDDPAPTTPWRRLTGRSPAHGTRRRRGWPA